MTAVIAAYALFAYAGLEHRAALPRSRSASGSPPGSRCSSAGQAAINIAAVMGVAPLTGIPLPFLSYGGSSLVVLLAGVGILLNIAHRGSAAAACGA